MKDLGKFVLAATAVALFGRLIATPQYELLFEVLIGACLLFGVLLYGFGSVVEAIEGQSGSE